MGFFQPLSKEEYLRSFQSIKSRSEFKELIKNGYSEKAILDFIDHFGEDCLGSFEHSFYSKFYSGEDFAEDFVKENYGVDLKDFPSFISIDWKRTWENMSDDFLITENNYVFSRNF